MATAKQLKALAKGRAALAAKRHKSSKKPKTTKKANPCNPCRANPNFHYPRTNRGRPKKARAWNLGFYTKEGGFLGKTKITTSRDDAHAAARGYVGAKQNGHIIAKVVLTGPK